MDNSKSTFSGCFRGLSGYISKNGLIDGLIVLYSLCNVYLGVNLIDIELFEGQCYILN